MVYSMTGYGNYTINYDNTVVTIEIKSVNSRYLDIISKIPRSLQAFEHNLKKLLQHFFNRGRIELYITIDGDLLVDKKVNVNWNLLDEYMLSLEEIKEKYNIHENISLSMLLQQESLFVIQEERSTDNSFYDMLYDSVEKVCKQVLSTRQQEGEYLKREVLHRLENVQNTLSFIEQNSDKVQRLYRNRVEERIRKYMNRSVEIDENQLIQEIAVLSEKGDIQEEITRIKSHIDHFKSVIEQGSEIGRKLDFIVQELHREANTIGAKSIDATISEATVNMKSNIEKIKEQIQNIE